MVNPETAGPVGNGSKSLAPESKKGLAVQFVVSLAAMAALGFLQSEVDISTLPGWLQTAASSGLATVVGLLTAYSAKNR